MCSSDLDENKPTGSIKIRVETISYFLTRYREDMIRNRGKLEALEERLAAYERSLRARMEAEEAARWRERARRSLPVLPSHEARRACAGD